ncbi:MAG: acyl-CoA thioesterase [Myxococcota bacterium]
MMQAARFRRPRKLEPHHIDSLGHVNNLVWVEFVLELAHAHALELGIDSASTARHGGLWIIRRQEIDYLRPGLKGDEIIEETWVESMRGARSVRQSRFTRVRDGILLVSAVTHWAYVDARTQRPRRIDAAVHAALAEHTRKA